MITRSKPSCWRWFFHAGLMCFLASFVGCVHKEIVPASATGTPSYRELEIAYRVHGPALDRILSISDAREDSEFADMDDDVFGDRPTRGVDVSDEKSPVDKIENVIRTVAGEVESSAPRLLDTANISPVQTAVVEDDTRSPDLYEAARLVITYPHPEERLGYAQAKLTLYRHELPAPVPHPIREMLVSGARYVGLESLFDDWQPSQPTYHLEPARIEQAFAENDPENDGESGVVQASATKAVSLEEPLVIVMDVPRSRVDFLIVDLANSGFLDDQTRPMSNVHMDVRIDHGRVHKQWSRLPRLDDIIHGTFERGAQYDAERREYRRRLPRDIRRRQAGHSSQREF